MKIGVFDSGIGGLSVMKSLINSKYFKKIIYYGDTARVPYGVKDKNTIIRYSLEAVEFFKNFEIDLMIVACNSVSACAIGELRAISPFKVFGVIEAGVKATINKTDKNDNIFIIGTNATIKSKKYEKLLIESGYTNIIQKATPLFVPIVEEEIFDGKILKYTIEHYFKDIKTPDAIILGCTHFPLISKQISNYFNNKTKIIHSGDAIVEQLEKELGISRKYETTQVKYFASENPDKLKKIANKWLKSKH
jgi:glutamate racemase